MGHIYELTFLEPNDRERFVNVYGVLKVATLVADFDALMWANGGQSNWKVKQFGHDYLSAVVYRCSILDGETTSNHKQNVNIELYQFGRYQATFVHIFKIKFKENITKVKLQVISECFSTNKANAVTLKVNEEKKSRLK